MIQKETLLSSEVISRTQVFNEHEANVQEKEESGHNDR